MIRIARQLNLLANMRYIYIIHLYTGVNLISEFWVFFSHAFLASCDMFLASYYILASDWRLFYVCLGFAIFSLILLLSHLLAMFCCVLFQFHAFLSALLWFHPFSTAKPARRNAATSKTNLPSVKMVLLLLQLNMYIISIWVFPKIGVGPQNGW